MYFLSFIIATLLEQSTTTEFYRILVEVVRFIDLLIFGGV